MRKWVIYILLFLGTRLHAQNIDSLKLALKNAKHDTARCNILSQLAENAPDGEWEKYNEQLKTLAEKNSSRQSELKKIYLKHFAASLNNIGFIYDKQGDIAKALEYYNRSLKIREEIGDKKGIANSLNNTGFIYNNQGDIAKALEYFGRSLKIQEETGDKKGIASSLNNIGVIYDTQGDIAKALEYYSRSLKIREEIGDKNGIATSLNNIGFIYDKQGVASSEAKAKEELFAKALEYDRKSLKIFEEIGDKQGIAYSLNNIGAIYKNQGAASTRAKAKKELFAKALEYYGRSLKIREATEDKQGIAYSLNNIGIIYFKQKNYSKALDAGTKSLLISRELGYPENIQPTAKLLSEIYEKTNQPGKALEMYKLHIQMRDSVINTENKKKSIQQQFHYEYEKKAAADSVVFAKSQEIKNIEIQKQKVELNAKRNLQYLMFGGLILVIVFAGFMYNRFRITRRQKSIIEKQKKIVEEQKELVEEKQKEVLDSIHYARRIQTALLPGEKYIHKNLERLMK